MAAHQWKQLVKHGQHRDKMKLMTNFSKFVISILFSLSVLQANAFSLEYDHFAINVKDLDTSAEFYAKVLKLEETFDGTELKHIRWFSIGGDKQLHVIQVDKPIPTESKGIHLALSTKDFEEFLQHLRTLKIPFEDWSGNDDTFNLRPDGVKQIYLRDPDGYWIEINDASLQWPTPKTPKPEK